MAFKIKDGLRIGVVDVFNNTATVLKLTDSDASHQGSIQLANLNANQTYTLPNASGTIALTSDIPAAPTVNNGTLTLQIGTAAATNTTVTIGTGTGFSANTASNVTYDVKVGPALTNLASTMTGAGTGFLRKNGADTFTLDTNTYLTTQSSDFGTFAIAADSGYTWGTANTNTNQVADTTGDTLTLVRGLTGSTAGIDLFTSTVAGTDAIKIAHADTSTLSGAQGGSGIASITVDEMGHVTAVSTATYLTSYTETDTLQTVTGRGATSNVATITLSATTASTNTTTGTLVVGGGVGIAGALNVGGNAAVGGNLTITGDLTVNGTTTTINVDTVTVEDKNIVLGNVGTPSDTTADGGGITLKGATDKTFNWVNATDAWTSSEHIALAAGKNLQISGADSGLATIVAAAAAGSPTLTLPTTTGTLALTSDIPTVNNGTLGAAANTTGSTNTTVALNFSAAYSANTASNVTINPVVGPALVNLASTMTGAGSGFLKKNGADTYTLDTTTYLSSQANDFGIFAIGTDSGYTWGTANTNTNQVADTTSDTLTLVNGTGIDLFTNTVAGTDAVKVQHADTSTLSGAYGTNGISSITVDGMGHVTAVSTATYLTTQSNDFGIISIDNTDTEYTWVVTDGTTTTADTTADTLKVVAAKTGSTNGIQVKIDATNDALGIAHADTSSLSGVQGGSGVASITVDEMGHVTAVSTATYLTTQSNDFGTVTVTDTDSGHTWADTGSAVADTTGDTLTVVSGPGIDVDVSPTTDAIKVSTKGYEYGYSEGLTLTQASPTANVAFNVDSWTKTSFRAIKYVITAVQGTTLYQTSEILVLNDGASGQLTEFAVLSNDATKEVTYTVDFSTATAYLKAATPTATTSITFNIVRTVIAA